MRFPRSRSLQRFNLETAFAKLLAAIFLIVGVPAYIMFCFVLLLLDPYGPHMQ